MTTRVGRSFFLKYGLSRILRQLSSISEISLLSIHAYETISSDSG